MTGQLPASIERGARLHHVEPDRLLDIGCCLQEHIGGGGVRRPCGARAGQEPVAQGAGLLPGAAEVAAAVDEIAAPNGVDQSRGRCDGGGPHDARSLSDERNEQSDLRDRSVTLRLRPSGRYRGNPDA